MAVGRGRYRLGLYSAVAVMAVSLLPMFTGETASMAYFWTLLQFLSLVLSLNLITGFTGYINFGHIAYYGYGAYTVACLTTITQQNPYLFIPAAAIISAVIALLVGKPLLSVRGPYFTIATLGLGEASRTIIVNLPFFNYSEGLPIARFFRYDAFSSYISMWLVAAGLFALTLFIKRSRYGLMLETIREDEDLAETMGINTRRTKLAAYVLSSSTAGLIGGLTAITYVYAHPGFFSISINVAVIASLLLGGGGTLLGPVVGATSYFIIADTLLTRFPYLHLIIFGTIIMGIALLLPRGLVYLVYKTPKLRGVFSDA
jgi:branched-chain amino acid transport system permease protein